MRAAALLVVASMLGCGPSLLPTTIFHVRLDPSVSEPRDDDWIALAGAPPDAHATSVAAATPLGADDWTVWTTDEHGGGTLMHVRRTPLGLEAQSVGPHHGPCVRPTIRALRVDRTLVIVVESSTTPSSTERDAWLYAENASRIVPLSLQGEPTRLRVRGESERPLEHGWSRAAVQTATLEASEDAIVVHEHESVREIAADRPERGARSSYDVERARVLTLARGQLWAERSSLFDEEL